MTQDSLTSSLLLISDLGKGPLYFIIVLFFFIWGLKHEDPLRRSVILRALSWRLAMFWVGGVLLNTALKFYICAPRPWWIDPSLSPLQPTPSGGFGMPSGHTQSAVGAVLMMFGVKELSSKYRLSSLLPIGMAWMVLIAWSRVHLHEHSLAQVMAGALAGMIWAYGVCMLERHPHGVKLCLITVASLSACCLHLSYQSISLRELGIDVTLFTEYGVTPPHSPRLFVILSFSLLALGLTLGLRELNKSDGIRQTS